MTRFVIQQEEKENRIKKLLIVLSAFLAVVFFCSAVVGDVFGGTIWDKSVYAVATVLFLGISLSLIWKTSFYGFFSDRKTEHFQREVVQICCFAFICLMTLYYYNSASNYGHIAATKMMDSAFGIALLCMYRREELKVRWVAYFQAVAVAYYAVDMLSKDRDGKLMVLFVLDGLVAWIYIRLLGCLLERIKRREICRRFSVYGGLVLVLFVGMVIFRNTRTWPFSVVIPFGSLYLYRFNKETLNGFLNNFCYGCILAFWLMFGSALLFRPYYSFEFIRYPGWFSSVATAGLFWMVVFGCTITCILAKYDNEAGFVQNLKGCLFEFITLGAVSSYLIMGMARTALLGTAIFSAAAFLVVEVFNYRDNLKKMLVKILLIICPVFVLFPVVYTLTRCMPAVVGRPFWITRAEWFSDRIMNREPMDSSKYMNVPQLAESLLDKLLGIDINLSSMAGAESGPGVGYTIDENGELVFDDNVVGYYEKEGQIYVKKDYSFENDAVQDTSNGRFDIWKIYFDNLNLTGHDTMIVEDTDENIILYHAHNSYMQVAYDHGVLVGILFVAVVAGGLLWGTLYYKRNCREVNFAIYPVVVVISFMIAGMTEWIFHPSIPLGFAFLIGLTPLVGKCETKM